MGRDRNKGGVGNYFTMPRARRSEVRQLARQFAAEQLRANDTPYWADRHGIVENYERDEFMAELYRVADRICKTQGPT